MPRKKQAGVRAALAHLLDTKRHARQSRRDIEAYLLWCSSQDLGLTLDSTWTELDYLDRLFDTSMNVTLFVNPICVDQLNMPFIDFVQRNSGCLTEIGSSQAVTSALPLAVNL